MKRTYRLAPVVALCVLLGAPPAMAGTLSAPAQAAVGSTIEVGWDGAADPTDFISIDETSAPDRTYGPDYGYPGRTKPLKLMVPEVPGNYLIRYHLGSSYQVTASSPLKVTDVTATLTVPATVASGGDLPVAWTGPNNPRDFISLDEAGADDRTYGKYEYTSRGNGLSIQVLVPAGKYQVRYHLGATYRVIGTAPVEVTDVTATLDAPAQAEAGSAVSVAWTGPGEEGDFISIDKAGADDRTYGKYAYTNGSPVDIRAPDETGDYEVRYHQAQTYRVIARAPLKVGSVEATLAAPDTAPAGSVVSVKWTGPDNAQDFVSIDAVGAADRTYGAYAYTAKGPALEIRLPDEPGEYALRYHTGQTYKVLGSRALRVTPTTAKVSVPKEVVAGRVFEAQWEGPNNEGDFLTVVPRTSADEDVGNNSYTKRGSPTRIEAPRSNGDYEVRYLTGQNQRVLARAPLVVVPDATPGTLVVRAAGPAGASAAFGAVELVLDASGSMLQRLDGQRRIDLAKNALIELTRDVVPPKTPLALRVFGHKEADSCRTDLEIPLAPLDAASAIAKIRTIESKNLAKTPIGDSLAKVRADLAGASAPLLVVLMTDGEETCDGDPKAAIEALRTSGVDVRVNIVGFAIDDVALKETFQDWARAGGGGYFDASNAAELTAAMRATFRPTYEVVQQQTTVATGTVNGEPIELPSGAYRVRLHGADARDVDVTIAAGELETIDL